MAALDSLCHDVTSFVDGKVQEYQSTPVGKAKRGKPARYREKAEVMAFLETMLGGDGRAHLRSLAELYGPGGKPPNDQEHTVTAKL